MSQGAAFAGSAAEAGDAGYMFFNPAQITKFKGNNVSTGVSYIMPNVSAQSLEGTHPVGGTISGPSVQEDIGTEAAVPNASFSSQVTDNLFVGLGINAPFGMQTEYDAQWVGRYHGIDSEISTVNVNPVVAYKLNDKLSVAGGLNAQMIHARLTSAIYTGAGDYYGDLEGANVGYGWNAGVLYEPTDRLSLGLGYRSKIKHTVEGDAIITSSSNVRSYRRFVARVTVPAQLNTGFEYKLNDKLALLGEYDYTYWSDFQELRMDYDDATADTVVEENWKNAAFYSIGLRYDYDENWTFRTGVAYDNTPVKLGYRTPRIPDVDRRWMSIGATYRYNESVRLSGTYSRILFNDSSLIVITSYSIHYTKLYDINSPPK